MPFSRSGLYYDWRDGGDGAVVVFLHGLGSSSGFYYPLALSLAHHLCLMIDTPGAGRSPLHADSVGIKEIGTSVLLVLEELRVDARPVVLVGHSMAGMVVSYLAAENTDHLDIRGVVYVLPVLPHAKLKAILERRIELIAASGSLEQPAKIWYELGPGLRCSNVTRALVREMVLALTPRGYMANCAAIVTSCSHADQYEQYYRSVAVPVLLIVGEEDRLTPWTETGAVLQLAKCKVVRLEGVGHWACLEAEEAVARELDSFVSELLTAKPALTDSSTEAKST